MGNPVLNAPQSGLHSVGYSRPELIRPFVHGLIGHANCGRSGRDGASQECDGFGLGHGVLNHSSGHAATIVLADCVPLPTMVVNDYASRLSCALGAGGDRPTACAMHELAAAVGITYQAVAKLWSDSSKAFTASNNARAASHLKVNSDWLATGIGEMRPEPRLDWPFARVDRLRWDKCNDVDRGYIQSALNRAMEDCEGNRARAAEVLHSLIPQPEAPSRVVPTAGEERSRADNVVEMGDQDHRGGLQRTAAQKARSRVLLQKKDVSR